MVYLTVTDNAGNICKTEKHIKISTTQPVISVTYSDDPEIVNTENNVKYFRASRLATISGTALEEVKIDADYKYGRVNLSFNNDDKEPIYYYAPAFYLKDPKLDDKDIIELTDTLKTILYAEVFGNKNVKINGKAITLHEPQCTAGFYGLADNQYAYNITEDHKIEIMRYNTKYGKYEIQKMYSDDSDEIYSFEFNDESQAYEYDSYGSTVKFVVHDNYFFTINHGRYALNEEYKD